MQVQPRALLCAKRLHQASKITNRLLKKKITIHYRSFSFPKRLSGGPSLIVLQLEPAGITFPSLT